LAVEIRQDLSAVLDAGRIHRDPSAVWAVGRIRLGPLAGSASAAATALGCCANRLIGATSVLARAGRLWVMAAGAGKAK